jgi:hypothetical protein
MVITSAIGLQVGRKQQPAKLTPVAIPKEALLLPPPPPQEQPTQARQTPEEATQEVLEQWLKAKAELLAGGNNKAALSKLALPALVDRLIDDQTVNTKEGLSQRIDAKVMQFKAVKISPVRLEAQVQLSYSEQLLDAKGKVLKQDPTITLNNTYVFVKLNPSQAWQLADFRPGN